MIAHKLALSVAAAAFALLPVGNAVAHEGHSGSDPMTESLKPLKGKEFGVMFLKQMIHHHQMAVEMGELATKNTKRAELNQLGKQIISAQKAEIEKMRGWLKSWHAETAAMAQMPGMEKMMQEMDTMKAAKDADFDKMFLEHMTHHHQGAVEMAKLVDGRSDRAELKQLAGNIIKDQTKEIEQMKSWEKSWFGSAH